MLGLGSTLMMSPDSVGEPAPFDQTWTFTSAGVVSEWSFTDTTRVNSIAYQSSIVIGGGTRTNTMKIEMVANAGSGFANITLADALAGCPDGASIKIEVDYGIGKNNDATLRVATLVAGGTFITVDGVDQAPNAWRTVAPATSSTMGSTDNDLALRIPGDSGLNAVNDVLYIQRIRVYEVV